MKNSNLKWVVTFSGTGINLALGALYAWSVFKKPLAEAFTLNDKQTALPYSVAIIVFALMMVPAGRLQDKFGPRFVATLGGALVAAGFFVASLAQKGSALPYLVVGFGLLAGAGIGLGYASATPPAVKWFPPRMKGLIVGLVVGGFGLASVYVAPLTDYFIKAGGPLYAFRSLALIFGVAVIVFSQFLRNPPAGYKTAAVPQAAGTAPAPAGRDYAWAEMIKTPQFILIWIMFVFGAGAGLMVISFLAKMAKELASTGKIGIAGFVFVAILAVGNAGGRIIAGTLSDKIGRTRTMLLVFIAQAIILAVFPLLSGSAAFAVGSALIGFNYGACLSVFPSVTADFYGLKNLGMNYGIVFTAWGVGGFIMPIVAGAIKDATGSYTPAFYAASAICIVAAAMTRLVRPPTLEKSPVNWLTATGKTLSHLLPHRHTHA